ncbi:AzlD family protein [Rhodovibrio salinarum]|uniref:AzlD domain-containing protein n=1 Tax=Rhodovibrio salinarum TaxID=1087 RepID=A0A934QGH8_9PROT|nr:AzlD domain-containing protein [Rhodovibrio salinarum]MBK1696454.1 AzlD domain-containing protein [Rhodovibrio salinarum]
MSAETWGLGPYAVIGLMSVATYLLRAGGLFLTKRVPLTPRIERFLEYLAGSILISLVVALAIKGGVVTSLAVLTATAVVLLTRRSIPAIFAAVTLAAGLRGLGLF